MSEATLSDNTELEHIKKDEGDGVFVKAAHYNQHPSGIECKDIVIHLNGNLFNTIKYMWRHEHKGSAIADLTKAKVYLQWEKEYIRKFPADARHNNVIGRKYVLIAYPVIRFYGYFQPNIKNAFEHVWEYMAVTAHEYYSTFPLLAERNLDFAVRFIDLEISRLEKEVQQ